MLHMLFLCSAVVWNGARFVARLFCFFFFCSASAHPHTPFISYYFEVFSERYVQELQQQKEKANKKNHKFLPTNITSFALFLVFVAGFAFCVHYMIRIFNYYNSA